MRHVTLAACLLGCTVLTPGFALAQQASGATLEEIVVTAQRRAENLQDVPIAVTAVSGVTAAKLGLTDPIMLSRAIPGFQFARNGSTAAPFIRGVGAQSGTIGNEPSVATFIDDVYVQSATAGSFEMNNIESVEVLKGPQGTLFGRNATGGLVNIHTKNPTHEPTATVSATYGNYNTVKGQFYGSTGITDNLAVNLAAVYSNQKDGWGKNVPSGYDVFKSKSYGVRLKVLYEPTDKDTLLLNYSQDKNRATVGNALRAGLGLFSRDGYSPDRAGAGFYDSTSNDDDPYTLLMNQGSLKYSHDFDAARFVSITAYTNLYDHAVTDSDTTPSRFIRTGTPTYRLQSRMLTQEFQLLSPADSPVQWIMGTYFLRDKSIFSAQFYGTAFGTLSQWIRTQQNTKSYSGYAQATAEVLPRTHMTIGLRYTSDRRSFKGGTQTGPFALGSYAPQPGAFGAPASTDNPALAAVAAPVTFQQLTGRFSLDYKVSEDVMVYAAYNRGFKSGVYNLPSAPAPAVLPEELNAYSTGFKSQWADNRVRLNAEAYFYDYKNIQLVVQIPGSQILTNAGAAHIKGVDVDLTVVPVENLTISGGFAITDGKYTKFPGGAFFVPLGQNKPVTIPAGCTSGAALTPFTQANVPPVNPLSPAPELQIACDLKGKKTVDTPPFTVSLTAGYRIPSAMGPFDLTAGWTHGGGFYWDAANAHKEPTNNVFNASIQWSDASEMYSIRLWGQNLGQEKYASYATDSATSNFKYSPAAPRTFGVTVTAKH